MDRSRQTSRRTSLTLAALAALVFAAILVARPADRHLRAMALLTRFSEPNAAGWVAGVGRHDLTESCFDIDGRIPARLYLPVGKSDPPGMVLAHGVHRLGLEEPRLKNFSRAIASAGIAVLTPELRELADYTIDPKTIDTIGAAVHALRMRVGRPVGLLGMSFAGGLSLMTAADQRFASDLAFVVSIGGHDDLGRVLHFFVSNSIEHPDGTVEQLHAHDYGPLVLVYSHIDGFFPPEDREPAREALRYWLWEQFDTAKERAAKLSPPSQARMTALFEHKLETIRPELTAEIERQRPRFASVSPAGCMRSIRVPIYLLHGAGDNVIPASETLWLMRHAPKDKLAQGLVSKAISHVEMQGQPGWADRLALVHFMASLLREVE